MGVEGTELGFELGLEAVGSCKKDPESARPGTARSARFWMRVAVCCSL